MPLDANTLLIDGTTDADTSYQAPTSETNDVNGDGAKVLDISKTGPLGMVAVMTLPTAPTAFADECLAEIQVSDYVSTDFKTIATFPRLYALNRRLRIASVVPFVPGDIGATLTGASTNDQGVIRWYDRALEVAGAIGDVVVSQVAADSDFDNASETLTTSGVGTGTMQKASELTLYLSYGIYAVRFVTTKKYVRANLTITGGNFGALLIGVVDAWNFPLTAQ